VASNWRKWRSSPACAHRANHDVAATCGICRASKPAARLKMRPTIGTISHARAGERNTVGRCRPFCNYFKLVHAYARGNCLMGSLCAKWERLSQSFLLGILAPDELSSSPCRSAIVTRRLVALACSASVACMCGAVLCCTSRLQRHYHLSLGKESHAHTSIADHRRRNGPSRSHSTDSYSLLLSELTHGFHHVGIHFSEEMCSAVMPWTLLVQLRK
jgi:hypothetical protein